VFEFREVSKAFGDHPVFSRLSLTLHDREITYIIGSSGTGKSVLIKLGLGLIHPDEGRILVDGQDVTDLSEAAWRPIRKRNVLVFQHSTLFDSMTLRENVALPLRRHAGLSRQAALDHAVEYLELMQMADQADRMPQEIGPSERKRAAIARALALSPQCAILDEPTTGLDVLTAASVDEVIVRLGRVLGKTVIVVSHDIRSIFGVADRIIFLYKGQVHLDGSPGDFRESTDPVVRQFVNGDASGPMET